MSDLINRQAAIDALHRWFADGFEEDRFWNSTHVLAAIECLPSADAVEVVRCKDCKHNPKDAWFGCPMSHMTETQKPDTAWCWKGERKDG